MPGRPHHSEKWHSCWEQVKAKGHTPESAAAICTAQLGDESYVDRAAQEDVEARELHILGATGQIRTAMYEGREHLVIPVVALMEGVIRAVNAPFAEYVPPDVVTASPHEWNGRPAVIFHPTKAGRQCSANDPKILESHRFGTIFNAYAKDNKLGMEVWADPARLEALGHKDLLEDLRAGKQIEVSVGAFVQTELRAGEFNGKAYKAVWRKRAPDHIAFLPGKKGACSIEMGCGAHRAAADYRESERYKVVENELRAAGAPEEDPEITEAVEVLRTAIGKRHSASDQSMLQTVHDYAVSLGASCGDMKAAGALSDKAHAMRNGKMKDCPLCDGTGQYGGKDCEMCDGEGKIRAAESEEPLDGGSAAEEGEMNRAEVIAALMKCEHNPIKILKTLEGMSDSELKSLQNHCNAVGKAKSEFEQRIAEQQAQITTLEEKFTALETENKRLKTAPTKEEWLKVAPPELKTLLDRQKAQDDARRDELVEVLKTAQSEYNEDELKAMEIPQLEKLAKIAKAIEEPKDFSGRETVKLRTARGKDDVFLNPPNPYAEALKKQREGTKATSN